MSILRNHLIFSSSEDSDSDEEPPPKKMKFRQRINFDKFSFSRHEFKERFRMQPEDIEVILQHIGSSLKYKTTKNRALSPSQQVQIFRRWLGTGCQYHGVGDMHGVAKSSVCKAVNRDTRAILTKMFHKFVAWPENMKEVSLEFLRYGGFPSVVGVADGTLITIDAPKQNEQAYVDRYGNHSINTLMVCGPDRRFYFVSARWPGAVHDARVLRNSLMFEQFEQGIRPFPGAVVLGDSGYGARDWLIPPIYRNPNDAAEIAFNIAHKTTRTLIECAYGILKERFPVLNYMRMDPLRACKIISICATLHNIASQDDFPFTPNPGIESPQENWESEPTAEAQARINELLAYFT